MTESLTVTRQPASVSASLRRGRLKTDRLRGDTQTRIRPGGIGAREGMPGRDFGSREGLGSRTAWEAVTGAFLADPETAEANEWRASAEAIAAVVLAAGVAAVWWRSWRPQVALYRKSQDDFDFSPFKF